MNEKNPRSVIEKRCGATESENIFSMETTSLTDTCSAQDFTVLVTADVKFSGSIEVRIARRNSSTGFWINGI